MNDGVLVFCIMNGLVVLYSASSPNKRLKFFFAIMVVFVAILMLCKIFTNQDTSALITMVSYIISMTIIVLLYPRKNSINKKK